MAENDWAFHDTPSNKILFIACQPSKQVWMSKRWHQWFFTHKLVLLTSVPTCISLLVKNPIFPDSYEKWSKFTRSFCKKENVTVNIFSLLWNYLGGIVALVECVGHHSMLMFMRGSFETNSLVGNEFWATNFFLDFQSEKELLWDSIKADLEEKIHKLEEDKNNVDFSTGLWEQTSRFL